MGTAGISYRKRYRNADRGVFHLAYGRGFDEYSNEVAAEQVLNLTALAGSLSVQLLWTPHSHANSYLVEKSDDGLAGWTTVSSEVPSGSQGWLVTDLVADVAQFFRVSAVNELGAGLVSDNATATPTA